MKDSKAVCPKNTEPSVLNRTLPIRAKEQGKGTLGSVWNISNSDDKQRLEQGRQKHVHGQSATGKRRRVGWKVGRKIIQLRSVSDRGHQHGNSKKTGSVTALAFPLVAGLMAVQEKQTHGRNAPETSSKQAKLMLLVEATARRRPIHTIDAIKMRGANVKSSFVERGSCRMTAELVSSPLPSSTGSLRSSDCPLISNVC